MSLSKFGINSSNAQSLKPWKLNKRMEGGALYTAERNNKFYVVIDQSTLVDLLSQEDAAGLEHLSVHEFPSEEARRKFLSEYSVL